VLFDRQIPLRVCIGALLLIVLGCELRGPAPAPPRPALSPAPDRPPTPVGADRAGTETTIYLPRWFEDDTLGLRGVRRSVATDVLPQAIVQALIAGPNGEERASRFAYPLDTRTRAVAVRTVESMVFVELSDESRRVMGRPFSELVYWSLVYSLTEVPGLQRVGLERSGEPLLSFGQPLVPIMHTAGRDAAPTWARPR
jgi:hypothetical protein